MAAPIVMQVHRALATAFVLLLARAAALERVAARVAEPATRRRTKGLPHARGHVKDLLRTHAAAEASEHAHGTGAVTRCEGGALRRTERASMVLAGGLP